MEVLTGAYVLITEVSVVLCLSMNFENVFPYSFSFLKLLVFLLDKWQSFYNYVHTFSAFSIYTFQKLNLLVGYANFTVILLLINVNRSLTCN